MDLSNSYKNRSGGKSLEVNREKEFRRAHTGLIATVEKRDGHVGNARNTDQLIPRQVFPVQLPYNGDDP